MKRFLSVLLLAALTLSAPVFAEDVLQDTPEGGMIYYSMSFDVAKAYIWTNHLNYPWRLLSVKYTIPALDTNMAVLRHVRITKTPQYAQDTVTTNAIGDVETNSWSEVTNIVYSCTTTLLFRAGCSNYETMYPPLPDLYQCVGYDDLLIWTNSYTDTVHFVVTGGR